ncbi:MAG TPA: hypothetical protein VKA00_00865 [Trueperaceae bacterium]|nr:hypothetical protein [Trueperaceae bacterium]
MDAFERSRTPCGSGVGGLVVERLARLLALAAAGASGAVLFAVSEAGYASLSRLAAEVTLPAIGVLVVVGVAAAAVGWRGLGRTLLVGLIVGLVATAGLELVRIIGFRAFHSMPGSMPMLMGVLLTNRIMLGPDLASNLLGWADHVYNGVTFVLIYLLVFGRRQPWLAYPYALLVGTGFLVSPVPKALGAGFFGAALGAKFAVTVYLAHILFGTALFLGVRRARGLGTPLLPVPGED